MNPPVVPGDTVRILELTGGGTSSTHPYLGQTALVLQGPDKEGDLFVRASEGWNLYVSTWELP